MKDNPEQIKQIIAKEIFKECIDEIDKEICEGKLHPYPLFRHHADGLTMAKNIIRTIEKERYSQ